MTPQVNDRIYALLGSFGFTGALNDRWRSYLKSFGLSGTNDDMLYSFLGQLGFTGSLTDRWNSYVQSVGGTFVGFAKLNLNFANGLDTLDSRINFTRTSNATVTNSAGVITYAPHNLLTYSEQFDNAVWVKMGVSIPANTVTSPNGTSTANKLIEDTSTGEHRLRFTSIAKSANSVMTISIYTKATANRYLCISLELFGQGAVVTYDVETNTSWNYTDSGWVINSSSITPVGDGWYRCAMTVTTDTNTTVNARICLTNVTGSQKFTSYTGNGTSGLDIWGAQLEIGSTATTYNSTTVKNLLGYSELFDNAAWTKSNSFVQTNLLTYSEAFDNAAWGNSGAPTITANATLAPNGYQTAYSIAGASGAKYILGKGNAIVSGTVYTYSLYAKKSLTGFVQLTVSSAAFGTEVYGNFDLTNGVVGTKGTDTTTSTITEVGDGWYRCTITGTATANLAVNQNLAVIALVDSASAARLSGVTTSSSIFIWGAQIVQGATAGDYRRTDAAALPVYYANHNGVVCAEQLNGTAANATILESYTATGGSMTFSVWMRRITGTGNVQLTMDTGTTWTTQAITTSWARYSVTTSPAAGARTAGVRLVTSGDVIQVFGAMVGDSASLDPYVLNAAAAPSAAAYYGARFDYDPVTLAPKGLLIEEQRANLLLNSSLAGTNLATQNVTVTAVAHTLSFYGTGQIVLSGTSSATVVGDGAYPTRKTLTFTPTAGTLTLTVTGTVQYAQLEIGSFATSFIPTAASQVTRTADIASIQGSNFYSWYNQNEGSVAAQFLFSQVSTFPSPFSIDGATNLGTASTNRIQFYQNNTSAALGFDVTTLGSSQVNITFTGLNLTTNTKTSAAYKINDFSAAVNNVLGTPDTSGATAIYDRLIIGRSSVAPTATCIIKSFTYYPTRLSNDTLKGLTA